MDIEFDNAELDDIFFNVDNMQYINSISDVKRITKGFFKI